ncbi:MAG: hypothetical protein ACQEXG_18105 [Pseudomonadota bacterium]
MKVRFWPTRAIERWICRWPEIADQAPPWHEGLNIHTVHCLEKAGIIGREALIEAWEKGGSQRGQPSVIGVPRLADLRRWLEATSTAFPSSAPKAMIIDLSLEAEAALNHLKKVSRETASELICRLLVEADDIGRSR